MTYHSNISFRELDNITLPLPPESLDAHTNLAIYARFMQHLRHVPNSRMEIKILSSIQFTADMLDLSDAHVAKALVDLGLRAPRLALPADFLNFVDASLMRSGFEVGAPTAGSLAIKDHWDKIGEEDTFSGFKGRYIANTEIREMV